MAPAKTLAKVVALEKRVCRGYVEPQCIDAFFCAFEAELVEQMFADR